MSAIVPCPDPHAPCRTGGENVWIELPLSVFPDFPAVDICVCAGVDREIVPAAKECWSWLCRVEEFGVETPLELSMLGWIPFSLAGNGLPRPLEYSSEEC